MKPENWMVSLPRLETHLFKLLLLTKGKKMNSIRTLLCISVAVSSLTALGQRNYGMAGCGLGSQVFSSKGLMAQTSASTTNATVWNQLFAISSGTSNCEGKEEEIAQVEFVTGNLATLQKEMAQGEGETLAALSGVLGCQNDAYPALARKLKAEHNTIFATPGAIPVLEATVEAIHQDSELAKRCQKIS